MAKITLPDFIKSASGTIARKRYSDGTVKSTVITKKGTMYQSTYRPRTKISDMPIWSGNDASNNMTITGSSSDN